MTKPTKIDYDSLITPEEAVKQKIFPFGYHKLLGLIRAGEENKKLGVVGKRKWIKDYVFGVNIGSKNKPIYLVSPSEIQGWIDRKNGISF